MWRRVRIYFFGFALGIILVWALLVKDRETNHLTSWLPAERIMEEMRNDSNLAFTGSLRCMFECHNLNSLDWKQILNEGSVNFSESETQVVPRVYKITYQDRNEHLAVLVAFDSVKTVKSVVLNEKEASCDCLQ